MSAAQSAKHDRRDPMIPTDDLHMTTFTDARIAAGVTIGALQIGAPMDAVDNRILLCHALGLTRVGLITQSERALTAQEAARLSALVTRRLRGEPIAYIVGQREFFGLPFEVTPAVLIPRPTPSCWSNWRWSVCRRRAACSTWAPAAAPSPSRWRT